MSLVGTPLRSIHLHHFNAASGQVLEQFVTVSVEVSLRRTDAHAPYTTGDIMSMRHVGLPVSCVYLALSVGGSSAFRAMHNMEHAKDGDTASVLLSFPCHDDFCTWAALTDNAEILCGNRHRPLPW